MECTCMGVDFQMDIFILNNAWGSNDESVFAKI